jgi:hypothetical protein
MMSIRGLKLESVIYVYQKLVVIQMRSPYILNKHFTRSIILSSNAYAKICFSRKKEICIFSLVRISFLKNYKMATTIECLDQNEN